VRARESAVKTALLSNAWGSRSNSGRWRASPAQGAGTSVYFHDPKKSLLEVISYT
jgi:hypothetical protein